MKNTLFQREKQKGKKKYGYRLFIWFYSRIYRTHRRLLR